MLSRHFKNFEVIPYLRNQLKSNHTSRHLEPCHPLSSHDIFHPQQHKGWSLSLAWKYRCFIHPGVRDKRRVSEIDLSQPRHETAFWWCHNGPVTSQLSDPIKWPNHPLELIEIYEHINTHDEESLTQRCRRSTNVQLCLIFCTYPYGLS